MTNDAKKAIEALKTALITAPVLRHPDFSKRDFVQCDVSDFGVGLNPCQAKCSVTEKECFAAVLAVKRFRPYIERMPFTVITHHSSLKWLMSLKNLSGRLARWSLKLQAFDSL